jgi:hypothetical protein
VSIYKHLCPDSTYLPDIRAQQSDRHTPSKEKFSKGELLQPIILQPYLSLAYVEGSPHEPYSAPYRGLLGHISADHLVKLPVCIPSSAVQKATRAYLGLTIWLKLQLVSSNCRFADFDAQNSGAFSTSTLPWCSSSKALTRCNDWTLFGSHGEDPIPEMSIILAGSGTVPLHPLHH